MTQSPQSDRAGIREDIDEQLQNARTESLDLSPELEKELKDRLAPFYFDNSALMHGHIRAQSEAAYSLTRLSYILPNITHAAEMFSVSASKVPDLWISSVCGRLHTPFEESLRSMGIAITKKSFDKNLRGLFSSVMSGWSDAPDDLSNVPFKTTLVALGLYRSLKYRD